jgi:hypothetical protein
MELELDRDFSEFIASCVAHDVRFLIVGGYALAAHGHPRFTKDNFLDEGTVVQLGQPPIRIDLLTTVDGVAFDDCWERRIEASIAGQAVPFLSAEDLIANKKASGRPQDLADAAALESQIPPAGSG